MVSRRCGKQEVETLQSTESFNRFLNERVRRKFSQMKKIGILLSQFNLENWVRI